MDLESLNRLLCFIVGCQKHPVLQAMSMWGEKEMHNEMHTILPLAAGKFMEINDFLFVWKGLHQEDDEGSEEP